MEKPTYYPEWATEDTTLPATGQTNKVRPREVLRNIGWDKGQIPTCEEWNWVLNNVYNWVNYFEQEIESLEDELAQKTSNLSIVNIVYPLGITIFFNSNKDPSTAFPGTSWERTGAYKKTIRLASQDLSDVGSTGGSDSITLTEENLPSHNLEVNLTTSSTDDQSLTTSSDGQHVHESGIGAPGSQWSTMLAGTDNQGTYPLDNTSSAGNHQHTVVVPGHEHTVTGEATGTFDNTEIDITNEYILLVEWVRIS